MCSKDNVLGFMTGLACGAGIALLWAPKSGRQTRSLIAGEARAKTDHIKQQAMHLRDSANDVVQKSQEEVRRQKDGLKHAVEAGMRAYSAHAV